MPFLPISLSLSTMSGKRHKGVRMAGLTGCYWNNLTALAWAYELRGCMSCVGVSSLAVLVLTYSSSESSSVNIILY